LSVTMPVPVAEAVPGTRPDDLADESCSASAHDGAASGASRSRSSTPSATG
jgi:hypothetical protein